jgi:hypothetical protein
MLVHFAADEFTKTPAIRAMERLLVEAFRTGGLTRTCGNEVMRRAGAEVG